MNTKIRIWDGKKFHYPDANDNETNHHLQIGKDGFFVLWDGKGNLIANSTRGDFAEDFMGLQDKNGKDLYEGDIIMTINDNWGVIVRKEHCFEVTVSETQSSLYYADWIRQSEIIGNIHENPELLKADGEKLS